MGSSAYRIADEIDYERGQCLLEVGAERGEGSTAFLVDVAQRKGMQLFSIDPDPDALDRVGNLKTHLIIDQAENVLSDWQFNRIRFAWIDGADWPYSWHERPDGEHHQAWLAQREVAKRWGGDVTREFSATSHLKIAKYLRGCVAYDAHVIFDDTWWQPRSERWQGKGMYAVPYLVQHTGWTVKDQVEGDEPDDGYVYLVRR